MIDYLVDIEIFNDDLKVVWSVGGLPYRPYLVNLGDIESITASEIRPALAQLTKRKTGGLPCDAALQELAQAGHRLYETLFRAKGDRSSQREVDRIRARVEAHADCPTICFKVKPRIFVPWALMYSAETAPLSARIEDHESFWCLKYRIATIHDDLANVDNFEASFTTDQFDLIRAVHLGEFTAASNQLDQPETALRDFFGTRFGAPVGSKAELLEAWSKREARLGLLYFYCHANQTRIAFSTSDELDTIEFKNKYRKMSEDANAPLCLVFLNGCHTAVGASGGGFLEATGREGFCGFIGTETAVPNLFAYRFGAAAIARLYRGEMLIEILDSLRRQHWPLSLVYGLYACPFLRLRPAQDAAAMPEIPAGNYSDLPVGTGTL